MLTTVDAGSTLLSEIIQAFFAKGHVLSLSPCGHGHINKTYKLTLQQHSHDYLLQEINTYVFQDVEALMENIALVADHLYGQLNANASHFKDALILLRTLGGKTYYQTENKRVWRIYRFIPNTKSYEQVKDKEQAKQAGEAFGAFQQQVADINPLLLTKTIKGYHELPFVLQRFDELLSVDQYHRVASIQKEIDFIEIHKANMLSLDELRLAGQLPLRITHNDTKFNNILFDENDEPLCVVDYDTVMPGLIHHDYGDALRIIANTAAEDEPDLSLISFDWEMCDAFTKGFLRKVKDTLTRKELETLPLAIPLMPFMLAVRFLSDYLNHDPYFTVKFETHNLVRAKAQFKLVADILYSSRLKTPTWWQPLKRV